MAAEIVQHSAVVVLALLVLSISGAVAQDYNTTLFDLFEAALLNDRDALRTLQEIFFNPNSKQSPEKVCLSVSISVEDIADPESDYCEFRSSQAFVRGYDDTSGMTLWVFNSYYELHQQVDDGESDTQELANLITSSGSTSVFYSFDPSFYSIMQTLSSSISLMFPYDYYSNDDAHIYITTRTKLDEMPCWDEAVYAMRSVLMWVSLLTVHKMQCYVTFILQAKFYARTNINGTQWSKEETDRSSVSNGDQCQSLDLIKPHYAWILVLGIFYFSNFLVLTSTLLYFRKVFLWLQEQKKQIKTLYKASATVLTCVNIIALISDLSIIISDSKQSVKSETFKLAEITINTIVLIMIPAKVSQVLLILILETPVACFNTHLPNQPNTRYRRFAHAFALCQIIWFVHRLVNDAIISIIFFVLAPAQTLGIVTLLLATIASAIVFVAVLIHNFKGCNRKMCTHMICVTLNGLIICGLLVAISLYCS